jgi:hypothetical protein
MRILKLTLGWTLMGSLLATSAMAQSASGPTIGQPQSVRATAFEYDNYLSFAPTDKASKSPSDAAAPAAKAAATVAPTVTAEPAVEESAEEPKNEPNRLIGDTGHHGINVYGYIDAGITGNGNGAASHYNGLVAPNDRDDFQFNQVYLTVEKTLDLEKNCWDIGGRVDLMYGSDYIYMQSRGLETRADGSAKWNSESLQYGAALPQAYGEIGHGQLSAKLGHFYTPLGYEVMQPTGNFFYSHNFAVRYSEPTSHTGGLFTWKNSDDLSLFIGGVNGGDTFAATENSLSVLTGFAYTPKDEKYAFNFGIMTGGKQYNWVTSEYTPRTYISSNFVYNFSDAWQSVSQWDAGWQQNYDGNNNTADFYSFTQYLFYTINPCWKAGLRYDAFVDDQGFCLNGLRNATYADGSWFTGGNPTVVGTGVPTTVQAISAGLNWTPNNNIRVRPELRWDWASGQGANGGIYQVGSTGTSNGQFTGACDVIIQF